MKNKVDNFDITRCEVMGNDMCSLVVALEFVASPSSLSLEETIEKAIIEGSKFKKWYESSEPLDNVRVFHKVKDKLDFIKGFTSDQPANIEPVQTTFSIEFEEGSQLEIWRCDESNEPDFPLFRFRMAGIEEGQRLEIRQEIWHDLFVDIRMTRNRNEIDFSFSLAAEEVRESEYLRNTARSEGSWISGLVGGILTSGLKDRIRAGYQKISQPFTFVRAVDAVSYVAVVLWFMIIPAALFANTHQQDSETVNWIACPKACVENVDEKTEPPPSNNQ